MGWLTNLTTGRDNKTHDFVRVSSVIVMFCFPVLIVWGIIMITCSFFMKVPFDLMAAYEAFSLIIVAFGTYLAQGAGAVYMKRTTEPDGSQTTIEWESIANIDDIRKRNPTWSEDQCREEFNRLAAVELEKKFGKHDG